MQKVLTEIGQVTLTSIFSLAMMFLITRWGGKRQIAQMSPFDYLNAVTVGSIAAELATNLEAWYRPLTALLVYGVITWIVEVSACKSIELRTFWSGRAVILMKDGVILKENLRKATIDLNEFLGQARIAGYFNPNDGKIYINSGSKNAVAQIISHELTHSIETSSSYGELSGLVFDRLKATGEDINALRTAKRELYERNGVTLADETAIDQEIVAEYVEKNLRTDEKSIRELVIQKRSLAQRISDWIDRVLAKLGNKDAEERAFLNRAKRLYAKALRETEVDNSTAKSNAGAMTDNNNDIQFSLKNKNLDVNSRIPFTYLNDYISVSKGDNASLSKLETTVKGIKRGTYTNKATGYKADINSETINKALHPKSGKMNNFSTRYIDNLNAMRVLPEL